MNQPKVSIIIPVYQASKFIHRCLDSIMQQTFTDFEVIMVDDGSTDGSGKICDSYSEKDSRFKVLHMPNKGVASARNNGIAAAKGEYSIHVDSDDWIERDMLEELYYCAISSNADMVICDFIEESQKGCTYIKQDPSNVKDPIRLRKDMLHLHGSLWNKLIRHSLYEKFLIHIPEELRICEDKYVVCSLIAKGIKVAYLNKAFYHYDVRTSSDSIVRTFKESTFQSERKFIQHLEKIFPEPIYKEDIDYVKAMNLERAFFTKWVDMRNLYPDVQENYYKITRRDFTQFCVKQACRNGFNHRVFYYIWKSLYSIKTKLVNKHN